MLFLGDAEKNVEARLISAFRDSNPVILDSDILKVGHHGSKTSTSEEFLAAVSPEVAIISAGRKNRYGHPHQDVLDRLKEFGIEVMRTDRDGDIRLASNGLEYQFVR